ncbi:MAG: signal peptidase I [Firmicutes bacterium]|nr:signal peptidase I [Bacillota bacterium]
MESSLKGKNIKETLHLISTIVSWTIFVLLMICAVFLIYYFIATRLYATKGEKYEPKFSLYTIISPSMTPNIDVYDIVVDIRVDEPDEVQIGDVITFVSTSTESAGKTVTHRVISIIKDEEGNFSYQTKGDRNPIEDSGSVPFSNILGKVAIKIPQLGRIQLFVASKMGWMILIMIPALCILLKDMFKALRVTNIVPKQGRIASILRRPLYLPYKGNQSDDFLD